MSDRLADIKTALDLHVKCPHKLHARDTCRCSLCGTRQVVLDWLRWFVSELEQARAEVKRIKHNASHFRCLVHAGDASNAWGCPGCVADLRAENSDLRVLLDEARSHHPEKYRSSSDGGDDHASSLSEATRVAPSGEDSGQPVIREGWCPHCGKTRIEDYSAKAAWAGREP